MSAPPVEQLACDYCGLPVSRGWSSSQPAVAPDYCCYGCRFAAAVAQERGEVGRLRWNLTSLGLGIFFSMNVMVFTLVLWSLDVFPDAPSGDQVQAMLLWDLFRYLCLLFSLPVLLLLGRPLLENAINDLRRGNLGTDLLLLGGVAAAYVYSAVSVFHSRGHVYFEVGCMILVAVTLGRWLEATGKWKATDALKSLAKLLPENVDVEVAGQFETRPLDDVQPGDRLRVLVGRRIAVDGTIVRGESLIDQQIVTGESEPVSKSVGDVVYGGTLNLDGNLLIEASAAASSGSLQRLIDAVVASAAATDRWRRLADRISAYFTPAVLVIAVATLAAHWSVVDFQHGLLAGLAVLLIACPCALGVATPLATWAALGAASRRGVLFRDGDAVARLASVDTICFDKTGTLTDSTLSVDDFVSERPEQREIALDLSFALSDATDHVVAKAIRGYTRGTGGSTVNERRTGEPPVPRSTLDVQTVPGQGIRATSDVLDGEMYLGSERFMRQLGLQFDERVQNAITTDDSRSCCFIGWQGEVRGVFLLREALRPAARAAIADLKGLGIDLLVLTGDRKARASQLGHDLGVSIHSELLPEDKLNEIEKLVQRGRRVAMIGDGINDAPALALADVGVALGCGADVSRDAADVCLIHNDLNSIATAIVLARATQRTIRHNLIWAFSYNGVGILLAAGGWLNPMLAAVAMAGSSLFVVSNSLRLAAQETTPSVGARSEPTTLAEPIAAGVTA